MIEPQQEATPITPSAGYGRLWHDLTQKCLKWIHDTALAVTLQGFMGATTTSVSSTTTAETKSLVGTIVGTFTVPPNACVVGKLFRMKARGILTTGITASTITIFLKYAGTTIASTGAVAPTVSQSNMYWELEVDIHVRTIGATGTFFIQGNFHVQNAATPAAGVNWPVRGNSADPPAAVTVDTTVSSLLDLQLTTGNNLHTLTCNQVSLEALN
jgi:hypothetical protein